LLLIGDSLAVGMSQEFTNLSKKSNLIPKIYAKNGTTISYWLPKIDQILEKENPQIVYISLGTNDALGYDLNFNTKIDQFVQVLEKRNIKYIWILPPNISIHKIPKINVTRDLIKKRILVFYESNLYHTPPMGDGIHMSNQGYIEMARGAWKKLTGATGENWSAS